MPAPEIYKVKKGDSIQSIAKAHQNRKWETIWNAPENKKLVATRKKPDALHPGDIVTIPPSEKELAEIHVVTIKGKKYELNKKEFEDFNRDTLAALNHALTAARMRVGAARVCWDSFSNLNKDQGFVSLCISTWGPKLPPERLVLAAEDAYAKFKSAVASKDFKKIASEMTNAAAPINKAYKDMTDYRKAVTKRGEAQVAMLEFTRDTCFDIVTGIATAQMGGSKLAGAAAGGASGLVKSAAGEFGKYLAGTSEGGASAARNMILDAVKGGASGSVSAFMKLKGDVIIEHAAAKLAKTITGTWVGRIGAKKVVEFLTRRLEGAAKGAVESAVKNALKGVTGDTSLKQFGEEVAKDAALSGALNGLDGWFEKNFAEDAFDLLVKAGLKLPPHVAKDKVVDIIKDLAININKDEVAEALENVIEAAKGDETEQKLGSSTVSAFVRSNGKNLNSEILKRLEKH